MTKIVFGILVIFILVVAYASIKVDMNLLQQCIDDGNKEYQCLMMIRGRGVIVNELHKD